LSSLEYYFGNQFHSSKLSHLFQV